MIDFGYDFENNIILTTRTRDIIAGVIIEYIEQIVSVFSNGKYINILDDIRMSNLLFDHNSDYIKLQMKL